MSALGGSPLGGAGATALVVPRDSMSVSRYSADASNHVVVGTLLCCTDSPPYLRAEYPTAPEHDAIEQRTRDQDCAIGASNR